MATVEPFRPFPADVFPEPIRTWVAMSASSIGCDPSYIALPMLAALAAAIGNTRRIQLKRGWTEPPVVWAVIVGESGSLKGPALESPIRSFRRFEEESVRRFEEEIRVHRLQVVQYKAQLADWKRRKPDDRGDPPAQPAAPIQERFIVGDVTVEALAERLKGSPRGLILVRDELAGWFGGLDRNSKGRSDVASFLEMHQARPIVVDRKTGDTRVLRVPHAAVSICGSIQPQILRQHLGREQFERGFSARLLLAMPPKQKKQWTEDSVDPAIEERVEGVFDGLRALAFETDADGDSVPMVLRLTASGRDAWVEFYNRHAQLQNDSVGDLAAAYSKLEGYAARFSLIVHCARVEGGDRTVEDYDRVDGASLTAEAKLVEWFCHETRRIYAALGETEQEALQRWLVEWIERKGGVVTVRQLQQSSRAYKTADQALSALQALAALGLGVLRYEQGGAGRPSRLFPAHRQCLRKPSWRRCQWPLRRRRARARGEQPVTDPRRPRRDSSTLG